MMRRFSALVISLIVLALMSAALMAPMIVISITEKSVIALFKGHISTFAGMSDDDILRSLGQFGVQITPSARSYSIVVGAKELWQRGDVLPAVAILVFSVILPVMKTLYLLVRSISPAALHSGITSILLDKFQRFAMLDVFVTAIIVVFVSNGVGYEADFGLGFYLFFMYYVAHIAAVRLILPVSEEKSSWMIRQGA